MYVVPPDSFWEESFVEPGGGVTAPVGFGASDVLVGSGAGALELLLEELLPLQPTKASAAVTPIAVAATADRVTREFDIWLPSVMLHAAAIGTEETSGYFDQRRYLVTHERQHKSVLPPSEKVIDHCCRVHRISLAKRRNPISTRIVNLKLDSQRES